MPFQPINFAGLPVQNTQGDLVQGLISKLTGIGQLGQIPGQMEERELANAFKRLQVQQEPQRFQSAIQGEKFQQALQEQQANKLKTMTPLEAIRAALENQFYPQSQAADIALKKAHAKYFEEGGANTIGVMNKAWNFYGQQVKKDNPNLNEQQQRDAQNAIANGKNILPDGTPLNITPAISNAFDVVKKYGTTAALINRGIMGQQAEAELPIISDYISKGRAPYGDTLDNLSAEQIIDTFGSDKKSQESLGDYIASETLAFEMAKIREILASGKTTVFGTHEILNKSKDTINAQWPRLTNVARDRALHTVNKALKEAFTARQNIPTGAGNAYNIQPKSIEKSDGIKNWQKGDPVPSGYKLQRSNTGKERIVPK